MIAVLFTVVQSLFLAFRPLGNLLLENMALSHQFTLLSRNAKKPRFSNPDRLLWIFLRRIWSRCARGGGKTTVNGRFESHRTIL